MFNLSWPGTYTATTGGYVHMGQARPLTCQWCGALLAQMTTK